MSRVATNHNLIHYSNGGNQSNKSMKGRSSSTSSSVNSIAGRAPVTVRSAAPAPVHKETVHACPLCNKEYTDPRVLPCTHTYCYNCIREKLISNSRVTCPKCHHQVDPFEDEQLKELPRNLILSQEWRIGARPNPTVASSVKSSPYRPKVSTDKALSLSSSSIPSPPSTISPQKQDEDKRQSVISETNGHYLSPTTSGHNPSIGVASLVQPVLHEQSEQNHQIEQSVSTTPIVSNLIKIYSEATASKPQIKTHRATSSTVSQFDELTRIVQEAAKKIEQAPTQSPTKQRPEERDQMTWENLVHGSTPVAPPLPDYLQSNRSSPERQNQIQQHHSPSRLSVNVSVSPQRSQSKTNTNGYAHSSPSRLSPIPVPIIERTPPRATVTFNDVLQENGSVSSNSPKNIEPFDFNGHEATRRRSPSPLFHHSSIHSINQNNQQHEGHSREHSTSEDMKFLRTERFNPQPDRSSQIPSGFSTPSNSVDHDRSYSRSSQRYQSPSSPSSMTTTAVTTRVDHLLADQKRLEQEIQEQIKRLKYDYDDIRHQIDRKQLVIHTEVKNIASHLDDDITQHYNRKQKIYQDLAVDNRSVGTELERLRADTDRHPTNKQQLWDNLQQIEYNIQHIRQAVDQYKEIPNALTLAEGQRSLLTPPSVANVTPYKFVRIDHLSNLEPEAVALAENNKKILVGICNKLFVLNEFGDTLKIIPIAPSIRGIAVSKKQRLQHIAYVSHDETVSMIDINNGQTLDCVKETDSNGESGTFLPLGIDTDNLRGDVYVCDYRNSCVIKFDDKLEFLTQWRVYNHSEQYDEARPKLLSIHGHHLYMIVEHSCKSQYNRGIAYTFSLHVCDVHTGNIIKIIDAELLSTQRLRWPCSVQAIDEQTCYILDTMTSGKYFNGQWQKHWSRVVEIHLNQSTPLKELFQLDSEASTMAMNEQKMVITANGEILFVNLAHMSN